jgi:hypothetical protein
MDERRTAEGVEHLQAAARELLSAARAFLDVVEDVVEDSDRLSGAASSVADLVRATLGGNTAEQPWHRAAWRPSVVAEDDLDDAPVAGFDEPYGHERADGANEEGPSGGSRGRTPGEAPTAKASSKRAPAKRAPAKRAPAKGASAKRAPAKRAPARRAPAKEAGVSSSGRAASARSAGGGPGGADTPQRRETSRVRRIAVD